MIYLRLADDSDLPLIMAWRNLPAVKEGLYTQGNAEPHDLTWEEHLSWWKSRPSSWREFMVMFSRDATEDFMTRPVGVVTIGQCEYWEAETGILIGETSLWGRGVGRRALTIALDYLITKDFKFTRATILDSNKRSIRLYESLGFRRIASARPGESLYRKEL